MSQSCVLRRVKLDDQEILLQPLVDISNSDAVLLFENLSKFIKVP
jgi:hypothetical protein